MHDRYLILYVGSRRRMRIRLHCGSILESPSFSDNESFILSGETTVMCKKEGGHYVRQCLAG
jgi:hypothetical protein